MYKHILVPTDGSAISLKAAAVAARLAATFKARVTALYVVSPDGQSDASEEEGVKALAQISAATRGCTCSEVMSVHARPWESIIENARSRNCDLIVMTSHGRRGLSGVLLGNETQKVLMHSGTPVLVCS